MFKYNPANRTEVQIDDGEGKIQKMWRVDLNNKLEYPPELYGNFFEEDSFIIWYKYKGKRQQTTANCTRNTEAVVCLQCITGSARQRQALAVLLAG